MLIFDMRSEEKLKGWRLKKECSNEVKIEKKDGKWVDSSGKEVKINPSKASIEKYGKDLKIELITPKHGDFILRLDGIKEVECKGNKGNKKTYFTFDVVQKNSNITVKYESKVEIRGDYLVQGNFTKLKLGNVVYSEKMDNDGKYCEGEYIGEKDEEVEVKFLLDSDVKEKIKGENIQITFHNGKIKNVLIGKYKKKLHHMVMGTVEKGWEVHHKNGGCDNRKKNLQLVTEEEHRNIHSKGKIGNGKRKVWRVEGIQFVLDFGRKDSFSDTEKKIIVQFLEEKIEKLKESLQSDIFGEEWEMEEKRDEKINEKLKSIRKSFKNKCEERNKIIKDFAEARKKENGGILIVNRENKIEIEKIKKIERNEKIIDDNSREYDWKWTKKDIIIDKKYSDIIDCEKISYTKAGYALYAGASLHRLVMGMMEEEIIKEYVVDHQNYDRLDNREKMLKICTRYSNSANRENNPKKERVSKKNLILELVENKEEYLNLQEQNVKRKEFTDYIRVQINSYAELKKYCETIKEININENKIDGKLAYNQVYPYIRGRMYKNEDISGIEFKAENGGEWIIVDGKFLPITSEKKYDENKERIKEIQQVMQFVWENWEVKCPARTPARLCNN